MWIDSGGTLVTLLQLARVTASIIGLSHVDIIKGDSASPDYFGDYQAFNSSATKMGIFLTSLEDQIMNTLRAFDKK